MADEPAGLIANGGEYHDLTKVGSEILKRADQ